MQTNLNLWNIRNLEAPAINTYKVNTRLGTDNLLNAFKEAVAFFADQKHLEAEAALLSRCLYRMKMKFRSDKGLKSMEKLNRCLLQYLRVDFTRILANFYELIPKEATSDVYVPSENLLDFVLVRLQGVSMLLRRMVETSEIAAYFMENRMFVGNYWTVALIAFSLVSRIWIITKNMTRFCCKFYSEILPLRETLPSIGQPWLPLNYQFPDKLDTWLGIDWIEKGGDDGKRPKRKAPLLSIRDDSDVEYCGEYTDLNDDVEIVDEYLQIVDAYDVNGASDETKLVNRNKREVPKVEGCNNFYSMLQDVDIGEVIRRSEVTIRKRSVSKIENKSQDHNSSDLITQETSETDHLQSQTTIRVKGTKKKKKKKLNKTNTENILNDIDSIDRLKIFVKVEENHRNNQGDCISRKLDKLQWNMLRNVIKKCIKKADKNVSDKSRVDKCLFRAKDALKIGLA